MAKKKKRFGTKFSPQPMTAAQKKNVAGQRASREARGQKPGTGTAGIGFVPPSRDTVEVRRKGTREEVVALESDPTKRKELTKEPETFLTEEGEITGQKESIFQKEGEAPPSVAESVGKSVGIGAGIGASLFLIGQLGAALFGSAGLAGAGVARVAAGGTRTAVGSAVSQFTATTGGTAGLIGTTAVGESAFIGSAIQAASQTALRATTIAATKVIPTVGKIAVNTKNAAKISTYLWSLVKGLKNPFVIYGILGTGLLTS